MRINRVLFAVLSSMCNPAAEGPTPPPTDVFPEDLVVLRALASPSSNISADVQGDVCPGPAGHV